jgi:hypothetical protein
MSTVVWRPGRNPLSAERPFERRRLGPLEAAVYAAALGPALLLRGEPLWWLLLGLLLPLNTLLLAPLGHRWRLNSVSGLPAILLLAAGAPLQLAGLAWLLQAVGLAASLPVAALALCLTAHGGALLFLMGRCRLPRRELRRWSVQAAFWLPLPLAVLAAAGWIERWLQAAPWRPAELDVLLGTGGLRLLLLLLAVGAFQLVLRRRAGDSPPVAPTPRGGRR